VQGRYRILALAPETYTVEAAAKGFAPYSRALCEVIPGGSLALDISLELAVNSRQITVNDQVRVDIDPANNTSAIGADDHSPQLRRGPAQFAVNLRLGKTITFGEKVASGKAARDPSQLTFSISARNLLNHPNLALPIGNLSSPVFGRSFAVAGYSGRGAAGNRRIDLQIRFDF